MAWRIEFADAAIADLELIFEFLLGSYTELGDREEDAFVRAADRVRAIKRGADRLLVAPHRRTLDHDLSSNLRHVTMDRAVYYFELLEPQAIIRILAVLTERQDHRAVC